MAASREMKRPTKESRLRKEDWVRAAYSTLSDSGWKSLNVEALAKRLGVTKGSFYWHFKDRNDLLDEILLRWHDQLVITRAEANGGSPADKIRFMLDIVATSKRPGRGGSLELAMRIWARQDPKVATVVESVDQQRLSYTADLFQQAGFDPAEANARALLLFSYIFAQGLLSFAGNTAVMERLHTQCRALIAGH